MHKQTKTQEARVRTSKRKQTQWNKQQTCTNKHKTQEARGSTLTSKKWQ